MPHSSQVQGVAQAAPDEHLGRAALLGLSSFYLGSVPKRGHQAPQTLRLRQGTCCGLFLATKTHPPVFPDLLTLLISHWGWYVEKSQKGGSASWGECCRALRGKVAAALFATAGPPVRREVHQPLASSSLVSPHVRVFLWHLCWCLWTASPEKTEMVLKVESEWEPIYCLPVHELYVSKLMVKVAWKCKSPTRVLNLTVYLQWWLINKTQEFTWESLYLMVMCRFCGKWKSWDLRSSTYAEQTSYSKALVLWKQRYGKGMKSSHWSASLLSLLNTHSAEK